MGKKQEAMDKVARLMVFVSGGLAMADVISDYNVVLSLQRGGNQVYYQLSLAIVLAASAIQAVQLFRLRLIANCKLPIALVCCVLNFVQGHWLAAFYLALQRGDKWQRYTQWFDSTTLIEVTLEAVPMLLFQSYTLLMLASDSTQVLTVSEFSSQIISIGFSLLMASKTMFDQIRKYPKAFNFSSGADPKFMLLALLFSISSVFNRAITIIVAAYAFQGTVFPILGAMAGARFIIFALSGCFVKDRVNSVVNGLWTPLYRGIQYVFVDFYGDPLIAVLSLGEIIAINYIALTQDPLGLFAAIPQYRQYILPIVVASTSVRVVTQIVFQYLIRQAALDKAASDREWEEQKKAKTTKDDNSVAVTVDG
ncbi:hypothetical protein MIR68_010189 [Amoeboaphelidium protococcarum]|nr:hypothetical protein MIR68_010189 [Amoeboaphelidium protococcarum]